MPPTVNPSRVVYVSPADLQANDIIYKIIKNLSAYTIITALKNASSLAESYIANRYNLPFLAYGDDFKRAVTDIAIYDLVSGRGLNLDAEDKNFRLRYQDAIAWLEKVSKGVVTPEGQAGGSTGGGTGTGGNTGGGGAGTGGGLYGPSPRVTSRPKRGW